MISNLIRQGSYLTIYRKALAFKIDIVILNRISNEILFNEQFNGFGAEVLALFLSNSMWNDNDCLIFM
jgi:hypothetical protein